MKKYDVVPKTENSEKGYHYTINIEQILEHQKRSVKEIFEWIEQTNKLIYAIKTPEERERLKKAKNF